jgi:uncharacterized membrane protein YdbT with pleckstrin-like domain
MDSQAQPAPVEEKTVWEGHSSQVLHLPLFLLCGLAAGVLLGGALLVHTKGGVPTFSLALAGVALIPILIAFSKWTQNRCRLYQITTERIHVRRGVLSRKTDELELYRVKDYVLSEPFFLRMFGLGNIVLSTTDDVNRVLVLQAIPNIVSLRDQIRKNVENCRTRKNVRITEIE